MRGTVGDAPQLSGLIRCSKRRKLWEVTYHMGILLVPEGTRVIRRHQFKNLELEETSLRTKLVEVMEFQLSYSKS